MALKAAIIMSIISIAMLVTYGGDVISAGNEKTGFLHMDPSIRGSIFGIIPSAMLIISYFITRKEHNKKIGGLIMAGGILIIADRKNVVEGKSVDLGGCRIIKKK